MSMTDPIADLLTRIRNGLAAGKRHVPVPSSSTKVAILKLLEAEGYIKGFEEQKDERGLPLLKVELKYFDGVPVIEKLVRVSKPGRRVYKSVKDLESVANGLGVAIVSTSKGMMTEKQARKEGAGGEVICTVF
jgi:small subunit ribosomal protein S8